MRTEENDFGHMAAFRFMNFGDYSLLKRIYYDAYSDDDVRRRAGMNALYGAMNVLSVSLHKLPELGYRFIGNPMPSYAEVLYAFQCGDDYDIKEVYVSLAEGVIAARNCAANAGRGFYIKNAAPSEPQPFPQAPVNVTITLPSDPIPAAVTSMPTRKTVTKIEYGAGGHISSATNIEYDIV